MATIDASAEAGSQAGQSNRTSRMDAWIRWWAGGTRFDWGFALVSTLLIAAGYYDAWLNRHFYPVPSWEHVPTQAAWLAVTLYLVVSGLPAWRRDRRPQSLVRDGYGITIVGASLFLVGIVISGWWTDAFGRDFGVPAIFRLPNLLQIAGAALIVVGPLRASVARGELMAGPPAVVSAVLLLATITFFTQFDHPYIDQYVTNRGDRLPSPISPFDPYYKDEILGVMGLLTQTTVVTGVVLWILRQTRLPVGGITLMLTATAFLTATQLGHFSMVLVALIVGVLIEVALVLARPRADRVLSMRLIAVWIGALLSGVYLIDMYISPGTWWIADMTYGTVLACAMVGGLVSYVIFPGQDATRAASVLWPALTQESSAEAPDVTVERVEHALKVLQSTRDLGESPLVGMRCLASSTPGELRKTIEASIEHLRLSSFQQDSQAGQILDLYYVRRIGGHYAVTMRVGLSRAAYFNRRSYGVRRLVDRLRELEESASAA